MSTMKSDSRSACSNVSAAAATRTPPAAASAATPHAMTLRLRFTLLISLDPITSSLAISPPFPLTNENAAERHRVGGAFFSGVAAWARPWTRLAVLAARARRLCVSSTSLVPIRGQRPTREPNAGAARRPAHSGLRARGALARIVRHRGSTRARVAAARCTSGPGAQQRGGRDDRARELHDLAVLVHRGAAQQHVCLFLAELALLHQDRLRLVDDLALFERGLRLVELGLEAVERMEAADRHVEDRLHALLAEPVDDVGRHACVDRGLHGRAVGLVDEHRDRAARDPRDLEHLLEPVAARVLEVDQDHVGVDLRDPRQQLRVVADQMDRELAMAAARLGARLTQTVLEDRGAGRVRIDDQDSHGTMSHGYALRTAAKATAMQEACTRAGSLRRSARRAWRAPNRDVARSGCPASGQGPYFFPRRVDRRATS